MQARREIKLFELIDHPDFADGKKRWQFMVPMEGFKELVVQARTCGVDITSMCAMPILSKEQEQYLFRQFNALKYAANISALRRHASQFFRLADRVQEVKDVLFMCNVRLMVNYLKKKGYSSDMFMIKFSDACEFTTHAVDKFDFARGFKFSTYCINTLWKSFWRVQELENRAARINYMDPDDFMDNYDPASGDPEPGNEVNHREMIEHLFRVGNLNKREIKAILENGGIEGDKRTLEEIGRDWHVTRERVRQIRAKGVGKLRALLKRNKDLMEAM